MLCSIILSYEFFKGIISAATGQHNIYVTSCIYWPHSECKIWR